MRKKKGFAGKALLVMVLILTMIATMVPFTVSAAAATQQESVSEETQPTGTAATQPKLIAFTFDDGPSNNTTTLLDGLKSRGVPATFFMCGKNGSHGINTHQTQVQRMVREGHQLANHSYDHPSIGRLSGSQVANEFGQVEKLLFNAMGGSYMDFVRTPGGALSTTIRNNCGAPIILWSVDTLDWKTRSADATYNAIMNQSKDGSIVLMHDLYATSVTGALRAIDSLKKQGYEFVTVSELMRRKGVTPENGKSYSNVYGTTILPAYSAPTITGTTNDSTMVTTITMSSVDQGVTFYYTLDGSYPTLASNKYTGPFKLTKDSNFTVVGYDKYGTRTPMATGSFKKYTIAVPTASMNDDGLIEMSCLSEGASIYYTTDGSDPITKGILYEGPVELNNCGLRIVAKKGEIEPSEIATYAVAGGSLFTDLDAGSWYFDGVCKALESGCMNGMGDMVFAPNGTLTRAMMVQIFYNMEGRPALDADQKTPDFGDVKDADWFAPAVKWAYANGITQGMASDWFGASDKVTREQMVTMLNRYADKYKNYQMTGEADISKFTDSDSVSEYAVDAMKWAVGNGIISGYENGELRPKAETTRAVAAVIFARFLDLPLVPKEVDLEFTPVPDPDPLPKPGGDTDPLPDPEPEIGPPGSPGNPIPVDPPIYLPIDTM